MELEVIFTIDPILQPNLSNLVTIVKLDVSKMMVSMI